MACTAYGSRQARVYYKVLSYKTHYNIYSLKKNYNIRYIILYMIHIYSLYVCDQEFIVLD